MNVLVDQALITEDNQHWLDRMSYDWTEPMWQLTSGS